MKRDLMFYRFALYGFLKNLRFFDPFMLLFLREVGLSFFQIGLLYAVRDFSANLLEIPSGIYADAFGRRQSMVLSFVSYLLSFLVFYLLPNFYVYVLAMLLFGIGEAFRSGTHKALILAHLRIQGLEDQKVTYYGQTRAASQLGSAVSSLIAAALVFYGGRYRPVFLASMVPYALDLVNLASYPRILDGKRVGMQRGALWERYRTTLSSLVTVLRAPTALRTILNGASFDAFFKATKEYLQPILETLALSAPLLVLWDERERSALIVGGVYFIVYLLTSYASRHSDRFIARFPGLTSAINLTFVAGGLFLLLVGISSRLDLTALSVLVFLGFYVLYNLRKPLSVAFVSDRITHEVMASGLSVESQITNILMIALAPLLGALADLFSVGAALTVLGGMMLLLWPVVRMANVEQLSVEGVG